MLLKTLAAMYPATKFCSIVADMCIEGYPDRNVPTLLLYRGGQLVSQAAALGKPLGLRPPLALQGP